MDVKLIEEKINQIEAEMKKIGLWQDEPLPDAAYDIHQAFGADTMSLAQWLQFILIPRVRELLATDGPWPPASEVGKYAAQQYLFLRPTEQPGMLTTQGSLEQKERTLVRLLQEFDELFK